MVELVQQHPSGGYILDELHVGMAAEKIVVATEDRIRLFAEASDDFNPVHLDEAFAAKTAYRGRIAHGLLSASFGSAVVGTMLPGAGSIYISQTLAFHQPVRIDDVVRIVITVIEVEAESARVKLSCEGFVGETMIMDGVAVVRVPPPAQTVPALMQIVRDWRGLSEALKGAAVAVGAFDGVHRGHQAVIAGARDAAERLNAPLGVVSFDPHPRRWFQPEAAPFRLMTADQMAEALAPLGVDILYLLPFDAEMAGMTDAAFAERVLSDGLGIRHAAVGFDFTFGKGRSGSPEALRAYGERLGFTVSVAERLDDADGLKLSSSAVREALKAGDMARAAAILGRPFAIRGEVIHGDKRGRTIGVPTANIALGDYMRPAYGVYATRSRMADGRIVDGVASLGVRPMYALETPLLEVWLFDFDGDLYGQTLDTELVAWLRGEETFDGLDALKVQIDADAAAARAVLSGS